MPTTVLIAKSTYVWLEQLSSKYGRTITRLDQIPDEELATPCRPWHQLAVADRPVGAELAPRRPSSICAAKQMPLRRPIRCTDYHIADDLGGERPTSKLRDRAAQRGIRLASDMVPNHMGIDSTWVIEHPEWFISRCDSPYPGLQLQRARSFQRRPRRDQDRRPLLRADRCRRGLSPPRQVRPATRATSTTATTAPAFPGTTPRSSTTRRPRCASR